MLRYPTAPTLEGRVKYRHRAAVAEYDYVLPEVGRGKYWVIWDAPKRTPHRALIGLGMSEEAAWFDALQNIYLREAPHLLKDLKRTIK